MVIKVVMVLEMAMMIDCGDSDGGVGDIGGDGDHVSRTTAAVLHFFGTKQIICCHQMAVPLT